MAVDCQIVSTAKIKTFAIEPLCVYSDICPLVFSLVISIKNPSEGLLRRTTSWFMFTTTYVVKGTENLSNLSEELINFVFTLREKAMGSNRSPVEVSASLMTHFGRGMREW